MRIYLLTLLVFLAVILAFSVIFLIGAFSRPNYLETARRKVQENKKEAKSKIMKLLRRKGRVANDDVEKLLGVSNNTAERYLNDLEREGKIVQVGKTGQSVFYELLN